MKVISIIIATFNAEKVLERCLKGLKLQKKDEVEILIIDGASTDHPHKSDRQGAIIK